MTDPRFPRHRAGRIAGFALLAVLAFTAFGFLVTGLWNALMPALFGLKAVTFWQGLGLLLLCRILVGGFGRGHGHRFRPHRGMLRRWDSLSPEERERFRRGFRHGRCGCGPKAGDEGGCC